MLLTDPTLHVPKRLPGSGESLQDLLVVRTSTSSLVGAHPRSRVYKPLNVRLPWPLSAGSTNPRMFACPEPRQHRWRHFSCACRWGLSHHLRGKRQSSRRKRTHWKEMLQNSCSNLLPSADREKNLLRVARHKLRVEAVTLIEIYTTLLIVLVDRLRDKTTHPDWNYPLQFGFAEVEWEKQDWMIWKRGRGDAIRPPISSIRDSVCTSAVYVLMAILLC